MTRIQPLTLDDGSLILVEVERAAVPATAASASLPAGAEPTGLGERLGEGLGDAMAVLRNGIGAMARNVHAGLAELAPNEWSMEIGIGFAGETQPIPVIVSGSANASIKVTATWKRDG